MRLDTGPRQIAAQRLYRSLGFRAVRAYYELPRELSEIVILMELALL
jgi:ribosomal protein S18 acetylase RimI-like enzyme